MDQNSLLLNCSEVSSTSPTHESQLICLKIFWRFTVRAFFHKESLWSLLAIREILNERNNVLELVKQAKKTHHRGTMCSKYYSCGTWDRVSCWSSRMWFHILITATCTACTRWANTETALSSTHKKKQKNKKKKQPATQVSHGALNFKYVSAFQKGLSVLMRVVKTLSSG